MDVLCAQLAKGWGPNGLYGTDEKSNLYIVTLTNGSEEFTKVGLSVEIERRLDAIKKGSGYSVTANKIITGVTASSLYQLEQEILRRRGLTKHTPSTRFTGYTECFSITELPKILNIVDEFESKFSVEETGVCMKH